MLLKVQEGHLETPMKRKACFNNPSGWRRGRESRRWKIFTKKNLSGWGEGSTRRMEENKEKGYLVYFWNLGKDFDLLISFLLFYFPFGDNQWWWGRNVKSFILLRICLGENAWYFQFSFMKKEILVNSWGWSEECTLGVPQSCCSPVAFKVVEAWAWCHFNNIDVNNHDKQWSLFSPWTIIDCVVDQKIVFRSLLFTNYCL